VQIKAEQKAICKKYNADFLPADNSTKLGIANNVKQGLIPINGLRLYPEEGTSGWFLWAGEEMSQDPNFFVPIHVKHIEDWVPNITEYLGLGPGWRFLIAGDHVDVWFDEGILNK
jgi:hypothetical protein